MCGHFSSQIKKRVRSTHSISKLSRNVHNSLYLTYTIFKNCSKFCIFIVYNFSKNTHNFVCSIYMIFQKNIHNVVYSTYTIFLIMYTILAKNVHNNVSSTYTLFFNFVHSMYKFFIKCIIDSISIIFQKNEHNYA